MRRGFICVAGLAVSLALGVPSSAGAHHRHHRHRAVPTPSVATIFGIALQDAAQYWGTMPCGGQVAFTPGRYSGGALTPPDSAAMWSHWSDVATYTMPGDVPRTGDWQTWEGSFVDPHNFSRCVIEYSPVFWPNAGRMIGRWPEYAYEIAHEVEHLLNKWWLETPTDNGTLPNAQACSPVTNVNCPGYTGHNQPPQAEAHRPLGAVAVMK